MTAYAEASKAVFELFEDTAPVVEGLSIDEAFLDVRGLEHISGTPTEIAARLRSQVRERVGLRITVGIARTKFLAKVASAVAKPDGLLLVPPGCELEFLHPLPVERLWGVGRVTSEKLRSRGIRTVAEVAQIPEEALMAMLGRSSGRHLHSLSRNLDPRTVQTGRRRRSIGAQHALGRGHKRHAELVATLAGLVDRVARRLRSGGRLCRTVVLRMRFDDYTRATRSHTLLEATAQTEAILTAARRLLDASIPIIKCRGLTLIGVSLTNLTPGDWVQLVLPFAAESDDLDAALDAVRERFGSGAITRAALVGRAPLVTVPLLPD
jgi:DNA polymerase-4